MEKIPPHIICLLISSLKGQLDTDGQKHLQNWLDAHPEHHQEIRQLEETFKKVSQAVYFTRIRTEKAWRAIDSRTNKQPGWKRNPIYRYSIAAGLLVPLLVGGLLLSRLHPKEKNIPALTLTTTTETVKPGSTKAVLELSSGEKIILQQTANQQIRNTKGEIIGVNTSNTIAFHSTKDSCKITEKPNRIYVPIGGEYNIILSDGTQIWVNSDSRLSFPDHFYGAERIVELSGEAYFEVKHDGKPFIVKTKNSAIRVLGTAFNVCCYKDETSEQVTLVKGAVKVKIGQKNYPLLPGEQLTSIPKDSTVKIKQVDTGLYTSWKDNLFRFQDMTIEEIVLKLKRWYNVDFIFQNEESKKYRFTGAVEKNANLNDLLYLIESTSKNIKFEIKDKEITITKKQGVR